MDRLLDSLIVPVPPSFVGYHSLAQAEYGRATSQPFPLSRVESWGKLA
jgi:hypothetical protein